MRSAGLIVLLAGVAMAMLIAMAIAEAVSMALVHAGQVIKGAG